jgi:hypothetical protein
MANKSGGGANTNVVGLKFEQETSLEEALRKASIKGVELDPQDFVFMNGQKIGYLAGKNLLYKRFLKNNEFNKVVSKKLLPDEAFVNDVEKILYVIEKKFQHRPGSVDEKLQTCDFKLKQYKKLAKLNGYGAKYIYLLSPWFKQDQYKDVLEYINSVGCSYYFNEIPMSILGMNS